jgi:DNA (cytosine-5)-methyltransferase 1
MIAQPQFSFSTTDELDAEDSLGYRLIDLFSGAGGLTLGFTDSRFCGGFKSVWSLDFDSAAVETHRKNFGPHADCGDIEEWIFSNRPIPQADVVIGGPPCQGFSLLNKGRIGDRRRALWLPFMDVVERSGASVFVIENVAELLKSVECGAIEKHASKLGFDVVKEILLAADYGAPQTRKRTVIIGYKRGSQAPLFPPLPTHAAPNSQTNLPPWRTVRDVIADLPAPVGTEVRKVRAPLNLHFGRTPTEKSLKRYRAVPPGGNRFDLQRNAPEITPDCWIRKTAGGTDLFGRLWWGRPSVTIRTEFFKPEKGRYLHPDQHRPITHREAARLMGFPDDFEFVGSKVEIARQIGNAVPPPLAGAIASVVLQILDAKIKVAA